MLPSVRNITREYSALHIDRVNEGQGIRYLFERAAYELKVKPSSRQPRRKVGQERAADTSHLFIGKDTAAKQAKTDKYQRYGDNEYYCVKNINGKLKP